MIPNLPSPSDSLLSLQRMLQAARRITLILEGKAPRRLKNDEALERWSGHEKALALVGLRLALELRKRGRKESLEFFALRTPKGDFSLPTWLTEDQNDS